MKGNLRRVNAGIPEEWVNILRKHAIDLNGNDSLTPIIVEALQMYDKAHKVGLPKAAEKIERPKGAQVISGAA